MISRSASLLIFFAVLAGVALAVSTWRSRRRARRSGGPTTRITRWH